MRKDKRIISVLFVGIIVCSIYLLAEKKQMLTVNEEEKVDKDGNIYCYQMEDESTNQHIDTEEEN